MVDRHQTGNVPETLSDTLSETKEGAMWRGEFGDQYSERNLLNLAELDKMYQGNYGVTRSVLNHKFLAEVPRSSSVLEVGCNLGNQLILLHKMGFESLTGIEINPEIVKKAQSRVPWARVMEGSALKIRFGNASFDLVFTSGLLIHIAPQTLPVALHEIHRCAKDWIWGFEYYAPQMTEVPYRGHSGLLWKTDYANLYMQTFSDLELILEQRLNYLENNNTDSMFLLRKKK